MKTTYSTYLTEVIVTEKFSILVDAPCSSVIEEFTDPENQKLLKKDDLYGLNNPEEYAVPISRSVEIGEITIAKKMGGSKDE